jgi:ribosome biogenesis GTPase
VGGRKSQGGGKEKSGRSEQAAKSPRGFARGHGAHHHHRRGREAPRQVGSGRDRTDEGARRKTFTRLDDDALSDLSNQEKRADVERSVEDHADAGGFGAAMEGPQARGLVLEVRKGNFLTQLQTTSDSATPELAAAGTPVWKIGDVLRTFVRGTLQQFDLGLSSVVAAGDEIEVVIPSVSGEKELFQTGLHAVLTRVLPRRSEFRRVHASGRSIQTLAANVDRIFIVASAGEPDFRPGFVDRVLVCAAASNLPAALVLNKIDLGLPERDAKMLDVYRSLGIPVYQVSVLDQARPQGDVEALKDALAGHRSVFTGHSGVGKSSLLLALAPSLQAETVRTGEVSTQTGKGTHTTTHARLFSVDLGRGRKAEIIDTPGVREFTPAETDRRNLWGWFPEIARLQGQCGFSDCTHTLEKGCAVLAAVERGEINPRRYQSYSRIYETLPN